MYNLKKLAMKSEEHLGLESFSVALVDEMLETRGGLQGHQNIKRNASGGGRFPNPGHVVSPSTGYKSPGGGFFTKFYHRLIRRGRKMDISTL